MSISVAVDVIAAIAVSSLLGEAYGTIRRRFSGKVLAPFALGTLFGLIALVQMYQPIEPFEGLRLDLRNIPIALAGAFLGWRGLLPCLAMAAGARLGIGGVGMVSGICGIAISGAAGLLWQRHMARQGSRNFAMLMLLALMMSAHLLAGVVLPVEIATWFFTRAALPLFMMNLVAIPLIGSVLERENRRIQREHRMAAAVTRDADSGLLTGAAFVRDVTNAYAAQPYGMFSGFLKISENRSMWQKVERVFGAGGTTVLDSYLLSHHVEHAQFAGMANDGSILVPLTAHEIETISRVKSHLRLGLQKNCRDEHTSATLQFSVLQASDRREFLRIAETAAISTGADWAHQRNGAPAMRGSKTEVAQVRRSQIFDPEEHNILFAKADFLIERGKT